MKREKTFTGWIGKGFIPLLFACGLLLAALPAWSAVVCDALADPIGDFDNDGLLNVEECSSAVVLFGGAEIQDLDPNRRDVIVIMYYQENGFIPDDAFALVTKDETGLDIVVHVIPWSDQIPGDRKIVLRDDGSVVRAARITESLVPATDTDTKIGSAVQGIFIDGATVYTQRIVDKVKAACAEATICQAIDRTTNLVAAEGIENVQTLYIQHTIAHELGHILGVAPEFNKRFDGYHWKAGSGFIMDQSVVYTSRKGKVTFYITQPYKFESQNSIVVQ